jgi:arylsulfatase A-like enzyme
LNLIFITIDGARVDRIIHGNFYKKLIDKSAFFSKTITYAPYTIGAMHAIFSGTYGNKSGVDSYWSTSNFKKNQYKTLVKYLHDTEYTTIGDSINKLILPKDGFDELTIHDEVNDDLTQRHLLLLSNAEKLKSDGKKFFLYLHYSNIHTGIMQQVLKKYDNFSKEYFSNKNENAKFYDTLFKNADKYLETVITECEKLCLTDDTLIVVISDHGISIGEKLGERAYGVFCYDYTLNATSLFFHKSLSTKFIKNQVRSIDILPTILDILKIPTDPNYEKFDGQSLIPILNGDTTPRIAFSQSGNPLDSGKPPKEPNVWAVRTDGWKFILNIHDGTEELYDLQNDPNELDNLIDIKAKTATKLRLKLKELAVNN